MSDAPTDTSSSARNVRQPAGLPSRREWTDIELRVLDAVRECCERWGVEKTTIDDIAKVSGVSRATLYRLFPGGKQTLHRGNTVDAIHEVIEIHHPEQGEADHHQRNQECDP